MEKVIVGLMGFGNIGSGFAAILEENKEQIECSLSRSIVIKRILVKDPENFTDLNITEEYFTGNADLILNDPEIDIVVELIGGVHPAYEYITRAIESGKHVVTANKAIMAIYGRELFALADKNRVSIRFEGSVGGGIPIIASLTRSLAGNQIEEIVGIINGTTNYILTRMYESNMSFQDALSEAQAKGFAEADPSSDIEGEDAAYKISILTHVAFGVYVKPEDIPCTGIGQISETEIEFANELGYKIKLLATVRRNNANGSLDIHVHPTLVPFEHPLSSINHEFNALFIKGNAIGDLMLYGKGAGSLPTGSAVVGDVMEIVRIMKNDVFEEKLYTSRYHIEPTSISLGASAYYLRFKVKDKPGVLGKITTTFGKSDISLQSVVQKGRGGSSVDLTLITHEAKRDRLDAALNEIRKIDEVEKVSSILMVQKTP